MPKAIVIDTNSIGKGHFDSGKLKELADRVGRKRVSVWVPGQVVAEWARHAADDTEIMAPVLNRLVKTGVFPELTGTSVKDVIEIHGLIREIIVALENVEILNEEGHSAVAAIRDQILRTGPGAVKQGIRTGAADSAIVRDVEAKAGDLNAVIFVTDNKRDFEAAGRALGYEELEIVKIGAIHSVLAEIEGRTTALVSEPAPGANTALRSATSQSVVALLSLHFKKEEVEARDMEDPDQRSLYPWVDVSDLTLDVALSRDLDVATPTEIRQSPWIWFLGVWNVVPLERYFDQNGRRVTAYEFTLALTGSLEVAGYELDNDGAVVMQNDWVNNSIISIPYIVDVADDGEFVGEFEQVDVATASPAEHRFGDSRDALEWLRDLLIASGVRGVPEEVNLLGGRFMLRGDGERTALMRVDETLDEGWNAEFVLASGGAVTIKCSYDSDARAWLGRESFHRFPPFVITTEGQSDPVSGYRAVAALCADLFGYSESPR